jgi:rsbT co-antagonist protein RsbR
MNESATTKIPEILRKHEEQIVAEWISNQASSITRRGESVSPEQLKGQCREFVDLLRRAMQQDGADGVAGPVWAPISDFLSDLSRTMSRQGFSPADTATFVLSLKKPLFTALRREMGNNAEALLNETWAATTVIDKLALCTTDAFIKSREEIIARQQRELLELSTPVVKLWDGILALPLIGTLDSARTQIVMETLLEQIVATGAPIAIIDITGVPTVDTLVAQHLLKTVAAARLMGAECVISGIRPQIAQTIVHLGVNLGDVITKASLADAFLVALDRSGRAVVSKKQG